VNSSHGVLRRFKSLWLSAWPFWTLLVFASLAATNLLSAGYIRAAIAAPILLMAPGSLTLGAIFSKPTRPQGVAFVCYAALLSAIWSTFASLALYVLHVLITADSTYWCLLIVSVVLAIVAEARLLLGQKGRGTRVARRPEAVDPDLSEAEADEAEAPAALRGAGYYAIVAVVAGISLLAGGLYAYDHLPRPAPAGYTWIAWTYPKQFDSAVSVGSAGIELRFQIVHHQSDTTSFRLSAELLGTPSRPLANPVTVSIGPNQTFRGALYVPSLPNGCTYRLVLAITSARQIDPLTKRQQTWSINADIHDPAKSARACR
jgi:hypothetical protein